MTSKPGSDSGKPSFAGFKASKVSSVTQSLFGSDAKKETTASAISWTTPAVATAVPTVATATPVPAAEVKEEVNVEKVRFSSIRNLFKNISKISHHGVFFFFFF